VRFEEEATFKLFGQNRAKLFVKLELKGLLRGDFVTRQNGLQVMRRNGIINGNYWCDLEELPRIGPDGDKYIVEGNMTTLQRVGDLPAAQPPDTAATEPDEPEPNDPVPADDLAAIRRVIERADLMDAQEAALA
jgi:hypothetical protein